MAASRHVALPAPFNTWPVVAMLTGVGLVTSAFFFATRDIAGTIVFHNFLALFGVVRALAEAGALAAFERVQWPLLAMAAVVAVVIALGYVAFRRA